MSSRPWTIGALRAWPWRAASAVLALWLFAAAGLKAWALARSPTLLAPVPRPEVSWPIVIGLETLWGMALLASLMLGAGAGEGSPRNALDRPAKPCFIP